MPLEIVNIAIPASAQPGSTLSSLRSASTTSTRQSSTASEIARTPAWITSRRGLRRRKLSIGGPARLVPKGSEPRAAGGPVCRLPCPRPACIVRQHGRPREPGIRTGTTYAHT